MIQTIPSPTAWQYWSCSLDTPMDCFGDFAEIVAFWQAKAAASSGLPSRRMVDFSDFRGWLGRVAVARIQHDPFQVRFSLWGTDLTRWWGVDYTNRLLGEAANDPEAWTLTEGRYFAMMADQPFIGIACGALDQHDRSFKKILGLDLPFGEKGTLTHVIAIHMEIDLASDPATILPRCPLQPVLV